MLDLAITNSEHELDTLRVAWSALLDTSAADNVFLTWEWASVWWRHYGKDNELHVIRITEEGELIGLVPLYARRFRRFGLAYTSLHLLGDGSWDSDYLDVIARSGDEETVVQALATFLTSREASHDILFLNEVPESSPGIQHIRRYAKRSAWYWNEVPVACAYVELPADWDTFLKRLAPRMRTKIRSLTKALEQEFSVRYERCEREEDLPARLDDLFRLHALRWNEKQSQGVFASTEKRQFYREMAARFLERGWLRLYSLLVDGRYVAHQFCFEYKNRVFLLQEGFDPAWETRGVGNVLRAHVFRECIASGVSTYDFLAGVTPHKRSWGAAVKTTIRASTGHRTAKNMVFFVLPRLVDNGKQWVKALLPDRVLAWARSRAS